MIAIRIIVRPHQLIYAVNEDKLILLIFEHRKDVYDLCEGE